MEYPSGYTCLRPGGTLLTKRLLSLAGTITGRRVLDLGCGRGETAALLAREYGAIVTGADQSAEMIRTCRETYPELTFVTADAEDLPFSDSSFDIVVSECCFSVFADPGKAFREVYRVLENGGKLLISDLWMKGAEAGGTGMVRHLYPRQTWEDMVRDAELNLTEFEDARPALKEMYVQMIFDLGQEEAQRQMGLRLPKEEMKNVSYMMLCAEKR